jgi:hypothetical protein
MRRLNNPRIRGMSLNTISNPKSAAFVASLFAATMASDVSFHIGFISACLMFVSKEDSEPSRDKMQRLHLLLYRGTRASTVHPSSWALIPVPPARQCSAWTVHMENWQVMELSHASSPSWAPFRDPWRRDKYGRFLSPGARPPARQIGSREYLFLPIQGFQPAVAGIAAGRLLLLCQCDGTEAFFSPHSHATTRRRLCHRKIRFYPR